jgi:hypothetical protein
MIFFGAGSYFSVGFGYGFVSGYEEVMEKYKK